MRTFLTLLIFLSPVFSAQAHFGHVGELAGHAHWIGTGIVVIGSVLVGVLGSKHKNKGKAAEADEPEKEAEGETA